MVHRIKKMKRNPCILCSDLYNGESGAFRCLATGEGEVAFIELRTIKENTGNSKMQTYYLLHIFVSFLFDYCGGLTL
jgi:hypothetical protein